MPWYGAALWTVFTAPARVTSALAHHLTAVSAQMALKVASLHEPIVSSSGSVLALGPATNS